MIYFFAGFATGAVTALFSAFCWRKANTNAKAVKAPTADEARLNAEKKRREDWLKEQERQHENMMNYIGQEQKPA